MKEILGIIGILVLLVEIYGRLRKFWIQRLLDQKRNAKKPRKPLEKRPKSEADCRFCVAEKGKKGAAKCGTPPPGAREKGGVGGGSRPQLPGISVRTRNVNTTG